MSHSEDAVEDPFTTIQTTGNRVPHDHRRYGGGIAWVARRPRTWALVVYAVLSVAYVLVAVHLALSVNVLNQHDDAYFMRSAQSIVAGDWLGDYNQMTLIKGPGFTYFLVLNHYLHLPLTLTLALLTVASCGALVHVLGRLGLSSVGARIALFAILLFEPAVMPVQVIRDPFYHSIFLLTVAGMLTLTLDQRSRLPALRALLGGLALGLLWITREEGVWVLPAFAVLLAVRMWKLRTDRSARGPFAVAIAVFAVAAILPTLATSAVNQHEYGVFAVQDFKSTGFQSTIHALDTISGGPEIAQVPVTEANLDRAYRVSTTLRQLKPFLESPELSGWTTMSCGAVPEACGSYLGGLLPWALRDAAMFAGAYKTPQSADHFYRQIASEIDDACQHGDLSCRSSPLPLVPVMTGHDVRQVPVSFWHALQLTLYLHDPVQATAPSVGTGEDLSSFGAFLGDPQRTPSIAEGYVDPASGQSQIKAQLVRIYSVMTPVVFLLGVLTFLAALVLYVRRRPVGGSMLVVAMAAWTLLASRLGLIALIDATSFPAVSTSYLHPAFLILYVASFTSLAALVPALTRPDPRPAGRDVVTDQHNPKADT